MRLFKQGDTHDLRGDRPTIDLRKRHRDGGAPRGRSRHRVVLKEYLRYERTVSEEAKNRLEARGLPYAQLGKLRSQVARKRAPRRATTCCPTLLDRILSLLF